MDKLILIPSVRADLMSKSGLLNFLNSCLVSHTPVLDSLNSQIVLMLIKMLNSSEFLYELYPCIQSTLWTFMKRVILYMDQQESKESVVSIEVVLYTLHALFKTHSYLVDQTNGFPVIESHLIMSLIRLCPRFIEASSDTLIDLSIDSLEGPPFIALLIQLILHSSIPDFQEFHSVLEWILGQTSIKLNRNKDAKLVHQLKKWIMYHGNHNESFNDKIQRDLNGIFIKFRLQ